MTDETETEDRNVLIDNFFVRDFVSHDIISYGIGQVWLYHYKETLIGVRHHDNLVAYWLNIETAKKSKRVMAPTVDQITPEHIKECIAEMSGDGEKTEYLDFEPLMEKAF